jgi:hypothetical protein
VKDVLDDFVRVCSRDATGVSDELAERLGAPEREAASSLIQRALVLRDRRGDAEGTAVCFAGLSDQGLVGLAERFKRFAASMDLSELGAARYLYARKIASGTQLFMIAADGPLRLDRLIPREGEDAQGPEPIAGARPRDSVRLISAHAASLPYGVTTYRSKLAPGPVLDDYATQAAGHGYALIDVDQVSERPLSAALASRAEFRVLRGSGATLIATAIPDAGGSQLSIVQLLGAGVPRMAARP